MESPTTTKTPTVRTAPEDDLFLLSIDRWKKRALALFSLLAIIFAIAVVLLIEIAGLVEVWHLKFNGHARAQATGQAYGGAVQPADDPPISVRRKP